MEEPKLTRSEYYAQYKGMHDAIADPNNELTHMSYPSYDEYIMDFEGAGEEELYAVNRLHVSPDAAMYLMSALEQYGAQLHENGWGDSLAYRHMHDLHQQILDFPVKGDGTYEQTGL